MNKHAGNESGPATASRRPGVDVPDEEESTRPATDSKPRVLLLGKDGVPLPPVPARDPLAPIGYSVVLLADGLLHVRVVVGDTFVYADTINDSAEARAGLVRDFLELRPDLREHEERLVQILTVRCGVERAYAEAQALRGEVAP